MDCGKQVFFDKRTGTFYIISDDGNTCIPLQFPNTVVGAVGGRGARGMQGIQGPAGPAGGGMPFAVEINSADGQNFTAVVTGGTGPYTYVWSVRSFVFPGAFPPPFPKNIAIVGTGSTANVVPFQGIEAGLVQVRVTDANGLITQAYWWSWIQNAD